MSEIINQLRLNRPVPSNAEQSIIPELEKIHAVVYFYEVSGKPCAKAFQRRALKPVFGYSFRSEQARQEYVDSWIKSAKEKLAEKRIVNTNANIKVGDVMKASWGYEQTNVDFYQVIELVGKTTVIVRPIAGKRIAHDSVVPIKDDFIAEPIRKRVNKYGGISLSSFERAYKTEWNKEHYATPWGYGH